ncbi:hypothetical protein [Acrocarpospora sp. B8E8]|uniref:hypothetical protein n=1 Tax=Acrocarpospora sp. B8E8 TaxID=3153572 RepID=UPI00325D8713
MPLTSPTNQKAATTADPACMRAAQVATGRARWRSTILLVRPLCRAIDWAPLAVVAAVVGALLALAQAGRPLASGDALALMRIAGTLLGSAAAFALVDAMSADLGAAPVPRWVRQALRCLLAGGAAVTVWLLAFTYTLSHLPDNTYFPVRDLLVEMSVCLGIALAAAASAVRYAPGRQAAMAAVVVQLALVLATILLPDQIRLWPPTCGFGHWDEAHQFWLTVLPLPYLWLAFAGRDLRR